MTESKKNDLLFLFYLLAMSIITMIYALFAFHQSSIEKRLLAGTDATVSVISSRSNVTNSKGYTVSYKLSFNYEFTHNNKLYKNSVELVDSEGGSSEINYKHCFLNFNTETIFVRYNPENPNEHTIVACGSRIWGNRWNKF